MQENRNLADSFLLCPSGQNTGSPNWSDAIDFPQPIWHPLDDLEHFFAEGVYEFLCINRPDAPDHAGRQVFLDALCGAWRRRAQKARFELLTVCAVIDPFARGRDPLASGNDCRVADHGHDITTATRFCTQHAETILGIVVRDPLD